MSEETPLIECPTAATWRAWLERHHETATEVWLVYYKRHTGQPSVKYHEALEEALCYGWIDGKIKRLDDQRYMQRWTPRRPRSNWSAINRALVEKLTREGRMAPAGLKAVEEAARRGRWPPPEDK
jgi:uncharacterized protein YdeI (YjbR/CyaY-like superfamily)